MFQRLALLALASATLFACPPQPPPGQGGGYPQAGNSPGYGGGGAPAGCDQMCAHFQECNVLEVELETCSSNCTSKIEDPTQLANMSCEELMQMHDEGIRQGTIQVGGGAGRGGGWGGGGGTGQGCVMSPANQPVQDCPAGQECCGSHCWSRGMCAMPTGR